MKSLHSGGRLSLPLPPFSFTPIERLTDGFCSRWRKNISGDGGGKNWFFTERWGANKGLGEAPKSYTRKEYESATNPIAKRGQGGDFVPFRLPLAGSRDSVPCGVWGNAPTVPRPTCSKGTVNKAQAAKRPCQQFCASADAPSKRLFSECRGFRACGRDQRALRSPSGLLRSAHFHTWFLSGQGNRLCGGDGYKNAGAGANPVPRLMNHQNP